MKNLSDKDILAIIKDIKSTCNSLHGIVNGLRDIIQMFKK